MRFTILKCLSGAPYVGKYISVISKYSSPIEVIGGTFGTPGAIYSTNLPDINNANANSLISVTAEDMGDIEIDSVQQYTNVCGVQKIGNLAIIENFYSDAILLSDNLTTANVYAVFYGFLSRNPYNGTPIVTYELGRAQDIYTPA